MELIWRILQKIGCLSPNYYGQYLVSMDVYAENNSSGELATVEAMMADIEGRYTISRAHKRGAGRWRLKYW